MAEFFDIGKKCSQQECHQLDFLPLTCDACEMVFCKNHVNQASHHCTAADHKDRKVADCPLCKGPVPLPSNVQLDGAIQAHIEQGCNCSKPLKANIRCKYRDCLKKEIVLMLCCKCHQHFCLEHRFQEVHDCKGFDSSVTDVDLKEQLRNSNDFRNQCSDMMKKHFADYVKGTICIPPLTSDERIGSAGDLRNALAAKIQGGILLNGLPLLQATCDEDVQLPLPLAIRNQIRHLLRLLKLAADDSTQYITLLHPKIGFRIILSQSFVTKIEQVNNQMFRKRMRASFGNQKHQAYPDNQYLLHRILILISRSLCSSQFSALLQNAVQCTSNPNHSSYENITTFCDYVKKEIEMSSFDLATDCSFHVFVSTLVGFATFRGFDSKLQATFLSSHEMERTIFTPIRYQEGFKQRLAIPSKRKRFQSLTSPLRVRTNPVSERDSVTVSSFSNSNSRDEIQCGNNSPIDIQESLCVEECATVVRKFYGAKWLPNIGEKTAVLPFLTAEEDRNGTVMQFVDYLLSAKLGGILFTALPSMRYYSDMKARLKLFPEDALLALSFLQQLVHTATLQSQKSEQKRALDSNYFIFFHPTLGVRVLYGRNLQGDIKMQIALQVLLKCLCPSADNMKFKQTPISAESARFLCDELEVEVRNSSNSNFKQQSTCLNLASTFLGLFTFIGYVADVNKRLFLTCDQWLALQSRSMLQIIYGPPNTGKSTLLKILLLEQYNADEERDELERRTQGNGDCLKTMIELSKLFQAQYTRQHQRPVLCIKEEHLEEYKSFLDATKLTEHVEVLLIDKDKLDLTDIVKEAGTRSLFIDSLPHFTFELKETIRARDYKTVVILDCDLSPGLHQPKLYYLEWLRLATQPKRVMENEPPVPSVPASNTAPDTLTENLQSEGDKHQKGDRKNNFPQFFEQALKTFDQFYPEWKEILNSTASETILIPACLDVTHDLYCGPLEEDIPGYDVKGMRKRKGQTAEDCFLRAFRELKVGGILIGGFDTQFFLSVMMERKVPNFGDKKLLKNWNNEKKHFECDFIFLHQKLGVYVIEIKDSFQKLQSLKKAGEQIEKQRKSIPELFKKLTKNYSISAPEPRLPIGAAISFPLSSMENMPKMANIDFIDMEMIATKNSFRQFWDTKFNVLTEEDMPTVSFHLFITALIGYRSLAFISNAYNVIEIHHLLCNRQNQYFGKVSNSDMKAQEKGKTSGSIKKNNNSNDEMMITANNADDKGTKTEIDENVVCLRNAQVAALECTAKCQLIAGPPGTGKTLIILEKARKFAQMEGKGRVILCVYNPFLVPRFEQYFANQVFKRKPLIVSGIPDFNINNKFCEYDDWFCDEMPLQMNTSTLRIYGNRMNSKGTTVLAVTGWMKPKDLRMVREIATTQLAEYVLFELDTTLRGSLSIIGEWQLDLPDEVPIRVGHSISGEKVERYKYTTVMEVLEALYDKLMPFYRDAMVDISEKDENLLPAAGKLRPCQIAVLTEYGISAELVLSYLSCRGIACGSPTDQSIDNNLVAVSNYLYTMSFEWPIVFIASVVSLSYFESLHLIGASRSMAKLIIIERDYMPVQKQIDGLIENCEDIVDLEPAEFKHIVMIAREVLNDNEPDSFLFDHRFAAVRHNYFPQSLRSLQLFRSCNDLSDFFTVVAERPFLCLVLLETDKVRQTVDKLASSFYTVPNRPTRIITELWSHLPEEEIDRRWSAFQLIAMSLKNAYGHMRVIAANGKPDEVFARMFIKTSTDWNLVWEVLQVYLLTSIYCLE